MENELQYYLQDKNERLEKEVTDLLAKLQLVKQENEELKKQNQELKEKVDELERENEKASQSLDRADGAMKSLKKNLLEVKQTSDKLGEGISEVRNLFEVPPKK